MDRVETRRWLIEMVWPRMDNAMCAVAAAQEIEAYLYGGPAFTRVPEISKASEPRPVVTVEPSGSPSVVEVKPVTTQADRPIGRTKEDAGAIVRVVLRCGGLIGPDPLRTLENTKVSPL